ncbi:hypothetical protein [Streptomyces mirabilis]|uniref:hypothetical protein n=1 Tax=Streptomyces mirabilis TaxID=68239 RepID=UPI0033A46C16
MAALVMDTHAKPEQTRHDQNSDETILPADYQRIIDVVRRAGTPVMVKKVCRELGMSTEPTGLEARETEPACRAGLAAPARQREVHHHAASALRSNDVRPVWPSGVLRMAK